MEKLKRLRIWIKVLRDYCLSFFPLKGHFLSSKETIDYVYDKNKSIIRLGDGEFNIILGGKVHYQDYNPELQKEMLQIIKQYTMDSPYLLCVPYKYFSNSNLVLNKRVLISCWSTSKQTFKKYIKKDVFYGDAFVFSKNNSRNTYQRIWEKYSAIILVHNNKKYLKELFDLKKQRCFFVEVPSKNSYDFINKIEQEIKKTYEINNLSRKNTVVLLSAGPTAKVLVYRLSLKGYKMIDCGHVWDDPLEV